MRSSLAAMPVAQITHLGCYSVMPQNFSGQNLKGFSFKGEDLTGANFNHADIRDADFT